LKKFLRVLPHVALLVFTATAQQAHSECRRVGTATIRCTLNVDETLGGCSVVHESQPGIGLGDAALRISRVWKLRPKVVDGKPAPSLFQRTLVFDDPPGCLARAADD
jgi:hypothetical protein